MRNINIKCATNLLVDFCLSVCHTWVQDNDWKCLKGQHADEDNWELVLGMKNWWMKTM